MNRNKRGTAISPKGESVAVTIGTTHERSLALSADLDAGADLLPANLLFVLVDQMRYTAMGCAGNCQVHTPNLDRLAAEGALFRHAISNIPVCTPARACLLTGQYPLTHTVLTNNSMLPENVPSLGTILKGHGYATGHIGKWHLAGEAFVGRTRFNQYRDGWVPPGAMRHGFDYWATHHCSHAYWNATYYRDEPDPVRIEGWEPDAQTRLAIDFIRDQARRDPEQRRPFALVVSWGPPHTPFTAPPEFRALYDPARLELRPNALEPPPGFPPAPALGGAEGREKMLRDRTAWYYAAISSLDHNLGRLLDALDAEGIADDTLVVFTSDHGELLGSHAQMYKCQPWDESIRVPLLMRYPRCIRPGTRIDAPVNLPDVLPTLLGLMNVPAPAGLEGEDLAPVLRGKAPDPAERAAFLLWVCSAVTWGKKWSAIDEFPGHGGPKGFIRPYRGVRTRTHSYIRDRRGPWLLFDNERDPYQMHNLVADRGAGAVPPELDTALDQWLEVTGDLFEDTAYYVDRIDLETGRCLHPDQLQR